jgi:tRNA(Ile)-lysidine synthase
MINAKIPRHTRDLIPILCDAEKILWVCGWRVDARVLVTEATRRVLKVSFVRRVANGE